MQDNLFCKSFLTIQFNLCNKIKAKTLVNTYTTRFSFINKEFVKIVYKKLEIKPQRLTKSKPIQIFDDKTT